MELHKPFDLMVNMKEEYGEHIASYVGTLDIVAYTKENVLVVQIKTFKELKATLKMIEFIFSEKGWNKNDND